MDSKWQSHILLAGMQNSTFDSATVSQFLYKIKTYTYHVAQKSHLLTQKKWG